MERDGYNQEISLSNMDIKEISKLSNMLGSNDEELQKLAVTIIIGPFHPKGWEITHVNKFLLDHSRYLLAESAFKLGTEKGNDLCKELIEKYKLPGYG